MKPITKAARPGTLGVVLLAALAAVAPAAKKRPQTAPAAKTEASPPATTPEIAARVEGLVTELRHPARRPQARAALKEVGPAATPILLRHADDPDYQLRWEIANAQGDLRDPRAIPQLVEYVLADDNPHVRWRSLWALREYPDHEEAVARLFDALEAENPTRRWNGAVGLSMFENPACLPILHEGLAQEDDWRSWEAINALSRVHDDESLARIEAALPGARPRFRREAAVTLGLIEDGEPEKLLLKLLNDEDPQVRWRAAMSLRRLRVPSTLEALKRRRLVESDPFVIEHLAEAISELNRRP